MSPYAQAILSLLLAVVVLAITVGLTVWRAWRAPGRLSILILALGLTLLTLHEAHALELALSSGLFDLGQSRLAAGVALLFLVGFIGFRCQEKGLGKVSGASEKPPLR